MKKSILVLILLVISHSAFADVCGIVTKEQGEKSLAYLTKGTKITGTYGTPDLIVSEVTMTPVESYGGGQYFDLKVNGVSIDPGHTNIIVDRSTSLNLGRLVGCDDRNSDPDIISR